MSTAQRQKFKEVAGSRPRLQRARASAASAATSSSSAARSGMVLRVIPMQIRTIDELGLPPVLEEDRRRRARPRARHRHDRQRQEHDAGGDDRPHQPDARGARHDGRGSDRVPPPRQPSRSSTSARSRSTRDRSRRRCAARCARIPTSSWSARCATSRRSRPALLAAETGHLVFSTLHTLDATETDQPHHRRVPAAPAEAGPPAAGQRAQGGRLAAPDAARRRQRPRAGGRGHDQHRLHPRLHRRQGEDAPDPRRDRRRARRSTACRPSTSRSSASSSRASSRYEEALRWASQRRRVQAEGAGHLDHRRDEPRPDGQHA